jgi:hypothetical protein
MDVERILFDWNLGHDVAMRKREFDKKNKISG